MQANPFSSPMAGDQVETSSTDETEVPPEILESMRQTKTWVTFLAILGLLATSLMILGGLIMVVAATLSEVGLPAWMGLIYLPFGAIYIYPSLALLSYGRDIGSLLRGGGQAALAKALERQKSFWKYVGIMALVLFALYVVGIGVMAAGAAISAITSGTP